MPLMSVLATGQRSANRQFAMRHWDRLHPSAIGLPSSDNTSDNNAARHNAIVEDEQET